MTRILFYTCLCFIFLLACKDKNYGWKLSHSEILANSDKIIIKSQKQVTVESGGITYIPDGKEIYEVKGKIQLNKFKSLFDETQRTGYCCCPHANFLIEFYNSEDNFMWYMVDTIEYKSKVRAYRPGFQYSYLVDKYSWESFLSELKK